MNKSTLRTPAEALDLLTGRPGDKECTHRETALFRLDCGAGGIQYRRYCLSCWHGSNAIPHQVALAELKGAEAPLADIEQLRRAHEQAYRCAHNMELGL